ncbi:response regulator [uncultured Cyclobacterium sp.]|uniref:response regulator n=1 Tax=uncultured Cyclobacterium sp. TaxID=453820 RepID=UPI0030ECB0F4|tara:strand:- start:14848 stop:15270 length:423 start_codon:yes stop_codon:yes gene_type:complete
MSKSGTIVIVEDDRDDVEIFESIVRDLNIQNKIEWFAEAESAYKYLSTTSDKMFLIFSDINMPGKNGLEFKREIDATPELRKKSIPFVFFSTAASQKNIDEAYLNLTIQGFFVKGSNYDELKKLLKNIFEYWMHCKHPNA